MSVFCQHTAFKLITSAVTHLQGGHKPEKPGNLDFSELGKLRKFSQGILCNLREKM